MRNNAQPEKTSTKKTSELSASAVASSDDPEDVSLTMLDEEDTSDVFEIISDLDKELDVAFASKDAREDEITALKQRLAGREETAVSLEAEVRNLKSALRSQEEMNSALEFLESERLEATKTIKTLEEQLDHKSVVIEDLKEQIDIYAADIKARDIRIEQIELEAVSSTKIMRDLQGRVTLLEQEKKTLIDELESTMDEMRTAIMQRDESRKELDRTKQGLDKIRQTLSKTRAKAKGHYYRKKRKKIEKGSGS